MKLCTHCGYSNEDSATDCASCGNQFTVFTQPQQSYQIPYGTNTNSTYPQQNVYSQANYSGQPLLSDNPVLNAVKTSGASTLLLLAAIFKTVSVLISVISNLLSSLTTVTFVQLSNFFRENEYFDSFSAVFENRFDDLVYYGRILNLISIIPVLFLCLGLWLFYNASRNASTPSVKTTGLTMIKGYNIYSLVSVFLVLVLIFFMLTFILNGLREYLDDIARIIIMIVAVVISCIVAVFPILLFVFKIKTINTIKKTIKTGIPSDKVSVFVAVVNFILASFSLFSFASFSAIMFISVLCDIGYLVTIGIWIFTYRGKMQLLMNTQTPPSVA